MPAGSLIHCPASRQRHHKYHHYKRYHMPRSSSESLLTEYPPRHIYVPACVEGERIYHNHHQTRPGTWMPAGSLIHCPASRQRHHHHHYKRYHMPRSWSESLLTQSTPSHIHSRLCRGRENYHNHYQTRPGTWRPAGGR